MGPAGRAQPDHRSRMGAVRGSRNGVRQGVGADDLFQNQVRGRPRLMRLLETFIDDYPIRIQQEQTWIGSDAYARGPVGRRSRQCHQRSASQLPAFQDRATRTVGRSTALAPRPPVAIRLDFHLRTLIHTTGRGLDHALKASSLRYRVRLRGGPSFSLSLLRCFQAVETSSVFLSSSLRATE